MTSAVGVNTTAPSCAAHVVTPIDLFVGEKGFVEAADSMDMISMDMITLIAFRFAAARRDPRGLK
jgi:hypothetical protein